jgi:hypothetical protein
MNALIVYMQWLDSQTAILNIPKPARPFPPLVTLTGIATVKVVTITTPITAQHYGENTPLSNW